jgi:hypothetical protein
MQQRASRRLAVHLGESSHALAHHRSRRRRLIVTPIWIFVAFIGALVIGSLIAQRLGVLPSAEELEAQDRARFRKLEHE